MIDFTPFPKIPRLSRDMIVTEKLDGTNAQIFIPEDGTGRIFAASRNRWLLEGQPDNFGFRAWVEEHAEELKALGPGQHFGEWWGAGVGRRYGLAEKRFSLFNVGRWTSPYNVGPQHPQYPVHNCTGVPLVHVVPVLLRHTFDTAKVDDVLTQLAASGSVAAPGFMQPEGVVVFHQPSGQLFKKTLDKNDTHKEAA